MSAHETPDAVLTGLEADRLRARALELVAELHVLPVPVEDGGNALLLWAGSASVILRELARG